MSLLHKDYYFLSQWEGLRVNLLIGQKDRLSLFKKIAKYVSDGIDLQQAVSDMSQEYLNNNKRDVRGLLLAEWNAAMVEAAEDFSHAVSDFVSPTDAMMIKAGEESGNLVDALHNVIEANESQAEIRATVKSEMTLPAVLAVIIIIMMFVAKNMILPAFENMLDISDWPSNSMTFRSVTLFFAGNLPVLLISVVAIVYTISISLPNLTGIIRDKVLDRYPPWSAYRKVNSSLFLISLSAMMKTGTAAYDSIKILWEYSPRYIQTKLEYILDLLEQGVDLGDALDRNFFDDETMMDVRLYTKGNVSTEAMVEVGKSSIENTKKSIAAIAVSLRFLMMFAAGGYMLWMIMSVQAVTSTLKASIGA